MQHQWVKWLVGLSVICLALLGGGWIVLDLRLAERCNDWTVRGMEAAVSVSSLLRMELLRKALAEENCDAASDSQVWLAYAETRIRVPEVAGRHRAAALKALQRAQTEDPGNVAVTRRLAEAWLSAGYTSLAIREASRVLETIDDPVAARVLTAGLLEEGRHRELIIFLDTPNRNGHRWLDGAFWFRLARLRAAVRAGKSYATLERLAAELSQPGHSAVAVELLQVHLLMLTGKQGLSLTPLMEAIRTNQSIFDADLMASLIHVFKFAKRPDLVLFFLEKQMAYLTEQQIQRLLALAWQAGRADLIAKVVRFHRPRLFEQPEFVFYGALAGEVNCLAAIRSLPDKDTEVARRWRRLSLAVIDKSGPAEIADAAKRVLESHPSSAVVLQLAAEAWSDLAEPHLALAFAQLVINLEPFWLLPRDLAVLARARITDEPVLGNTHETTSAERGGIDCSVYVGDWRSYRACWQNSSDPERKQWNVLLAAIDEAQLLGVTETVKPLIDALIELTPAGANNWRLARARALLVSDESEEITAEAALLLGEVITITPDHAIAHLLMSTALVRLSDPIGAGLHVMKAVSLDPRLRRRALHLSYDLYRTTHEISATRIVQWWWVLSRTTGDGGMQRFRSMAVLADAAERSEDIELAEAIYRRILRSAPDADVALNNLAVILLGRGEDLNAAERLAMRAVALNPRPEYSDTLRDVQTRLRAESDPQ